MHIKKIFLSLCFCGIICASFGQDAQPVAFTFNHVALAVKDLEKSADFYMNVLRLSEITNRTENPERRWLSLGEDKELHLILDTKRKLHTNIGVHMALTTPDFDAFFKIVKESNVQYYDWTGAPGKMSTRADGIRQIYIQDPDGYWIEINSVAAE